jgi:pimeloyl-ACP methyl ester carboxylesterase
MLNKGGNMRTVKKRIATVVLAIVSLVGLALPVPAAAHGEEQGNNPKCESETLRVKLAAEDTTAYNLKGWLCWQGGLSGKTVQVLVSGFTYDHHYWDFPFQAEKYSYVRQATHDGYATFNIDRIGVGKSDRPLDPTKVTMPSEAFVAHQVVQALRDGKVNHTKFKKVIGVGHSMGAGIWMIESSTYPNNGGVDGLILTDYLHQANPATQAALQAARVRAQDDPKFASLNLPEGYFTTKAGFRHLYFNPEFADPRVIAKDEVLKQTATLGEAITINVGRDPVYTSKLKVPTLVVVGEKDTLFCDEATPGLSCANKAAVIAREAPLFNPATCLEVFVLPVAGHDTNLHPNAKKWYDEAERWSDRRVGSNVWRSPTDRCVQS